MTTTKSNFVIDVLLFLLLLGLILTGAVIYFLLPPGTGHSLVLFGFSRHDFGALHFYLAVGAIVLFIVHIVLHWRWVCCVLGKSLHSSPPSEGARRRWGVYLIVAVLVLVIGGLLVSSTMVEQSSDGENERPRTGRRLYMKR